MRHKDVSAQNKITVITGLPGTGKSTLLKNKIIPSAAKPLVVVDPNMEYAAGKGVYVFRLKNYGAAAEEVESMIKSMLANNINVKTLIVDESNVVFDKLTLLPAAKRFVNTLRHIGVDLVCVARRPVDINITISELARERYIFRVSGVNDIKRLNEIIAGLGDAAANLQGHDYIYVKDDSRDYSVIKQR